MKTIKEKQILVGADFAGFPLKEAVCEHLRKKGIERVESSRKIFRRLPGFFRRFISSESIEMCGMKIRFVRNYHNMMPRSRNVFVNNSDSNINVE